MEAQIFNSYDKKYEATENQTNDYDARKQKHKHH